MNPRGSSALAASALLIVRIYPRSHLGLATPGALRATRTATVASIFGLIGVARIIGGGSSPPFHRASVDGMAGDRGPVVAAHARSAASAGRAAPPWPRSRSCWRPRSAWGFLASHRTFCSFCFGTRASAPACGRSAPPPARCGRSEARSRVVSARGSRATPRSAVCCCLRGSSGAGRRHTLAIGARSPWRGWPSTLEVVSAWSSGMLRASRVAPS
jgi:hypothetical protein